MAAICAKRSSVSGLNSVCLFVYNWVSLVGHSCEMWPCLLHLKHRPKCLALLISIGISPVCFCSSVYVAGACLGVSISSVLGVQVVLNSVDVCFCVVDVVVLVVEVTL